MRKQPLIVLKFGGSVLHNEERLRIAVHEIYRWRRDGWRVVAVVSALAGRTDELLSRCTSSGARPLAHAQAAALACGELESAALLGLHLDRAGVPVSVLTPGAVSLRATGEPLDADPVSIDIAPIMAAIERDGVVVFPGFIACDDSGRTVTLGRGGSDLTALFLAQRLAADKCRLIKDVDALYDSDPAESGPSPRRYSRTTFDDALATDGSIIQHKAVRFAKSHGTVFELGRFNGVRPTIIGAESAEFTEARDLPIRQTVALLGLGTVGGGVLKLLTQLPESFEVVAALVLDSTKRRDCEAPGLRLTTSPDDALVPRPDIVVEAIGGIEPAATLAIRAMASGAHVVTANKAMLAQRGDALRETARLADRRLLCAASVGGAAPMLERLASSSEEAARVRGVLNGTSNFVLNQITNGSSFEDAILAAQGLGLAEADPSRDLDGRDCLDKLAVIAGIAGRSKDELQVRRVQPITSEAASDAFAESASSGRLRQISTLHADGTMEVCLAAVAHGDPLFELPDEWNVAEIDWHDGRSEIVRGRGAGRWPTAESVLGDLLQLSREASQGVHAVDVRTLNHEVLYV